VYRKTTKLTDDKIITIANRISKVYFVLVCFGIIITISDGTGISENVPKTETWQGVINTLLYVTIYLGLRSKRKWLIPLILFASAWFLLSSFLSTFQPAVDIMGLVSKAVGIIIILFFAYQMHFFSKKEVKMHFGLEGTVFF